jgi:hypothetical protein
MIMLGFTGGAYARGGCTIGPSSAGDDIETSIEEVPN